jgi:hypothetical protein
MSTEQWFAAKTVELKMEKREISTSLKIKSPRKINESMHNIPLFFLTIINQKSLN